VGMHLQPSFGLDAPLNGATIIQSHQVCHSIIDDICGVGIHGESDVWTMAISGRAQRCERPSEGDSA
jgi:hypothetical protein